MQSSRDLKNVDNVRFNDNIEQSKVDEKNMNEIECKSRIENYDQITKSVK